MCFYMCISHYCNAFFYFMLFHTPPKLISVHFLWLQNSTAKFREEQILKDRCILVEELCQEARISQVLTKPNFSPFILDCQLIWAGWTRSIPCKPKPTKAFLPIHSSINVFLWQMYGKCMSCCGSTCIWEVLNRFEEATSSLCGCWNEKWKSMALACHRPSFQLQGKAALLFLLAGLLRELALLTRIHQGCF